jgi:hypothetical protein
MKPAIAVLWSVIVVASLAGAALAGFRLVDGHLVGMAIGWVALAYLVGRFAVSAKDMWLPRLMVVAMVMKLAGSWARLYVLEVAYNFSGDAGRYHGFGIEIAKTWRAFNVPDLSTVGFGSEGTRFISWLTGLLYAPYEPSLLGGFWIFALLAYLGQFFFYLAFRVAVEDRRLKKYALVIFFWPTFLYWPSSIGKEAAIMLFLGVGSWAVAHLYRRYEFRWLPLIAGAAAVIFLIRVHMAALFVGAILATLLLARWRTEATITGRRFIVLFIGVLAIPVLAFGVGEKFSIDLTGTIGVEDLDPVFEDVGDTTGQGGSAVSEGVIRSPVDIPAGVLKVLFRPLPNEAGNVQMLAASIEGTMLLGFVLWRLPAMLGNLRHLRSSPYLMFATVYTAFFVWAWSSILNLGIMARQRSLVLPFVLALVIGLGWPSEEPTPEMADEERPVGRPAEVPVPIG